MSVTVTIENTSDIERLLQTLPSEIFSRVQQVLQNGAIRLAERARELAPVRTGHLQASIHSTTGQAEDPSEAFSPVQVVADAEYATFVEFGTSKMLARPFMGPAVEELEPEIFAEVDAVLTDILPPDTEGETVPSAGGVSSGLGNIAELLTGVGIAAGVVALGVAVTRPANAAAAQPTRPTSKHGHPRGKRGRSIRSHNLRNRRIRKR